MNLKREHWKVFKILSSTGEKFREYGNSEMMNTIWCIFDKSHITETDP